MFRKALPVLLLLAIFSPAFAQDQIDLSGASDRTDVQTDTTPFIGRGEPTNPAAATQSDQAFEAFLVKLKDSNEFKALRPLQKVRTLRRVQKPWIREEITDYVVQTAFAAGVIEPQIPVLGSDGQFELSGPMQAIDWASLFELIWPYLLKFLEQWLGGL